MKNNRGMKLLILVLAVLVMVGAVFLIKSEVDKKAAQSTEAPVETYAVFTLGDETVKTLSWTLRDYPDTVYSFTKRDDGLWQYDPDPSFNVEHKLISSLVGYIRITNSLTKVNSQDMEAMGLANPAGKVHILTNTGREAELIYGNLTPTGDTYYGMNGDGNVYLLKGTVFPYFNKALSEFEAVEEESSSAPAP